MAGELGQFKQVSSDVYYPQIGSEFQALSSNCSSSAFNSFKEHNAFLKEAARQLGKDTATEYEQSVAGKTVKSPAGIYNSLFLRDGTLAIYYLNRLEIYSGDTLTRLCKFDFGFDRELWWITCVIECVLPKFDAPALKLLANIQVYPFTLLVGLKTGEASGKICLVNYLESALLLQIDVPFIPTSLATAWQAEVSLDRDSNMSFSTKAFYCPLVIGTVGGGLYLADLCFRLDSLYIHSMRIIEYSPGIFEPNAYSAFDDPVHPCFNFRATTKDHDSYQDAVFTYTECNNGHEDLSEQGKYHRRYPAKSVSVTSLAICNVKAVCDSQIISNQLLFVGFNFGCFEIWSLDTMKLLYGSRVDESSAPVTSLLLESESVLSHGGEQRFPVYLWVARGSVSTFCCSLSDHSILSGYTLGLSLKRNATIALESLECLTVYPLNHFGRLHGRIVTLQRIGNNPGRRSNLIFLVEYTHSSNKNDGSSDFTYQLYYSELSQRPLGNPCFIKFPPLRFDGPLLSALVKLTLCNYKDLDLVATGLTRWQQVSLEYFDFTLAITNTQKLITLSFNSEKKLLFDRLSNVGAALIQDSGLVLQFLNAVGIVIDEQEETSVILAANEAALDVFLHNDAVYLICECVKKKNETHEFDSSTEYVLPNPLVVLNWAWGVYQKIYAHVDPSLLTYSDCGMDDRALLIEYLIRRVSDLYRVFDSLLHRYFSQANGSKSGQAALQSKIDAVLFLYHWLKMAAFFSSHPSLLEKYKSIKNNFTQNISNIRYSTHAKYLQSSLYFLCNGDEDVGSELLIDYQLQNGNGKYPPEDLFSFSIDSIESPNELFYLQKNRVLCYLLLDIAQSGENVVLDFAHSMLFTEEERHFVESMWYLDRGNVAQSFELVMKPLVLSLFDDSLAVAFVKKLMIFEAFSEALKFLNARPVANKSLNFLSMQLQILLENGLVYEAYAFQRAVSRTSQESFDSEYLKTLLTHFFVYCYKNRLSAPLDIPLDDVETDCLMDFLKFHKQLHSLDLLLLLHLRRSCYVEALEVYQKVKHISNSNSQNAQNQIRSLLVESHYSMLPSSFQHAVKHRLEVQTQSSTNNYSSPLLHSNSHSSKTTTIRVPPSAGPSLISLFETDKNMDSQRGCLSPVIVQNNPNSTNKSSRMKDGVGYDRSVQNSPVFRPLQKNERSNRLAPLPASNATDEEELSDVLTHSNVNSASYKSTSDAAGSSSSSEDNTTHGYYLRKHTQNDSTRYTTVAKSTSRKRTLLRTPKYARNSEQFGSIVKRSFHDTPTRLINSKKNLVSSRQVDEDDESFDFGGQRKSKRIQEKNRK